MGAVTRQDGARPGKQYRVEVRSGGSIGTTHYLVTAASKAQARSIARKRAPRLSQVGDAELVKRGG